MIRTTRAMTPLFSVFASLCALTAYAAPPTYTLQPIQQELPSLLVPVPAVMNNTGKIAGYAYSTLTNLHLAWWNGTVLTDAGDPPHTYLGLIDMNDNGQVLGYTVDDGDDSIHGFIYQNGTYTPIPNFQYGPGINANGKVPFWNSLQESYFLWNNGNSTPLPMTATINGTLHDLSEPHGINDHDEIAYVSYGRQLPGVGLYVHGANPFAARPPRTMLDATIRGINNNRQIIGHFTETSEAHAPFLYSDNGTRGNGTFQFFDPDYYLLWLNQRGEILAQKDSDNGYAIFHDNAWHNLNDCIPTNHVIQCVYDLNDLGEIAAMTFDGTQLHLVILKPGGTTGSSTLRGQVNLPNPNGKTLRVTITGATTQTATVTLDAQGRFSLPVTMTGTATIKLKAANTLATAVNITLAAGTNSLPATVNLRGGDANDDNAVDIADLSVLIGAYNKIAPASGYSQVADFDNNGTNDIADLTTIINNYNRLGD